eukprot:5155030-Amphidinium_carterae.1
MWGIASTRDSSRLIANILLVHVVASRWDRPESFHTSKICPDDIQQNYYLPAFSDLDKSKTLTENKAR